jgi:Tfp pilus assembly major pilin PilA
MMNNRSGLTFADVLILLAIVLLLAALAIPKFVKVADFGTEEDEVVTETSTSDQGTDVTAKATASVTNSEKTIREDRK